MSETREQQARELAREIGKDIADRRGLKWEWNKVEDDVKEQQIYPAWESLLARALAACALEEAKWWKELMLRDDVEFSPEVARLARDHMMALERAAEEGKS